MDNHSQKEQTEELTSNKQMIKNDINISDKQKDSLNRITLFLVGILFLLSPTVLYLFNYKEIYDLIQNYYIPYYFIAFTFIIWSIKGKALTKGIIAISFSLLLTLPFHYVPSQLKVFPKDHLTFNYTVIMQEDIDKLVERINNSSKFEQVSIRNEPLCRILIEKNIIVNLD